MLVLRLEPKGAMGRSLRTGLALLFLALPTGVPQALPVDELPGDATAPAKRSGRIDIKYCMS